MDSATSSASPRRTRAFSTWARPRRRSPSRPGCIGSAPRPDSLPEPGRETTRTRVGPMACSTLSAFTAALTRCVSTSARQASRPPVTLQPRLQRQRPEHPLGSWHFHVGTYDGAEARSYFDGAFVPIPSFKDNEGNTHSKNPYLFADGLNDEPCELTVGAVRLSDGPGNFMEGQIARLRVWDRALSATEVAELYIAEATAL